MSLITISWGMGSGGEEIARGVAEGLDLELYDDQRLLEEAASLWKRVSERPRIGPGQDEGLIVSSLTRASTGWVVRPVGVVHSPFESQTGTPVQPALAGNDAIGTVEVFDRFAEALADLEGFERIWLICWLGRSRPVRMRVVPYLDTEERGLFSTRSPCRPNPIGISAVRLLQRSGCVLHVADLDLLDGTPVLDIKPYAQLIDVFPDTRDGWIASARTDRNGRADARFRSEGAAAPAGPRSVWAADLPKRVTEGER